MLVCYNTSMADYILIRKSRNMLSSVIHVIFNIILGIGSVLITVVSGSWLIGIITILISKWRTFAVRPRYWLLNLKSSLVDLIVGLSIVTIAYCSGTSMLAIHYILCILYPLWLVILKPMSTELATKLQALVAILLGTTATVLISASYDSSIIVIITFIIGYAAARHILIQNNDRNFNLVTLICGLVSAEIAWLCQTWLIVYSFGSTGIIIPQLSIILILMSFAFMQSYESVLRHDGKLVFSDVSMPVCFSIVMIFIIVFCFSQPAFNI